MQYSAPALKSRVFENYADTQQATGHLVEGGPLPHFLLTDKFAETPGVADEYAFHDYARRNIADMRGDAPLWESEMPRDTRAYSQAARNLRDVGTRSGRDAPDHSEINTGFFDQDTRAPGDELVPLAGMAAHARVRARYLKPTEPRGGASHLTEAITEGVETEGRRYEKLQEARRRARGWRLFSRSIENTSTRGVLDWHQGRSVGVWQRCESGRRGMRDTTMRGTIRGEYRPGDEKYAASVRSGSMADGDGATRRAAHAVARAPGGGAANIVVADLRDVAASRIDASANADGSARFLRHKARGPSEVIADDGALGAARGAPALGLLAAHMADCTRKSSGDAARADMIDSEARGGDARVGMARTEGAGVSALMQAATTSDAPKAEEILKIAQTIARAAPGHEASAGFAGGARGALVEDEDDSAYMRVDAVLMSMACSARGTPQEDLIRRQMITDARAPTMEEILAVTRMSQASSAMFRGFTVGAAARDTARDIESGDMEVARHNERARLRAGELRSAAHTTRMLTETQLVAEDEMSASAGRTASRAGMARTMTGAGLAVQLAGRDDASAGGVHAAIADSITPRGDAVRGTGAHRAMGPRTASRASIHAQEDMVEDRIRDT